VPGHTSWPGTGMSSRSNEDRQHAPIPDIRHRQIRLPARRRAMA
jgi:hypothetical protein